MSISSRQFSEERQYSSDDLALSEKEVALLQQGVMQWGGPARITEAFSVAMGFPGSAELFQGCELIYDALRDGQTLKALDWMRAQLATEIAFASDVVGAGVDWSTTTGLSDGETVVVLRSVQRKLVAIVAPVMRQELGASRDL